MFFDYNNAFMAAVPLILAKAVGYAVGVKATKSMMNDFNQIKHQLIVKEDIVNLTI